jgi:hypothetical protein
MPTAVNASTGYYWGMAAETAAAASPDSAFTFTATNGSAVGYYTHTASGLCLDAGPLPNSQACTTPATRALPFCNASLPLGERLADLVGRLTVPEMVALTGSRPSSDTCDTVDPGIPRLGVPPMQASSCPGVHCWHSPRGMHPRPRLSRPPCSGSSRRTRWWRASAMAPHARRPFPRLSI